jgi:hypothetical protein
MLRKNEARLPRPEENINSGTSGFNNINKIGGGKIFVVFDPEQWCLFFPAISIKAERLPEKNRALQEEYASQLKKRFLDMFNEIPKPVLWIRLRNFMARSDPDPRQEPT